MKNVHRGSSFDDFLEQEGLRTEAEAVGYLSAGPFHNPHSTFRNTNSLVSSLDISSHL
jgi:hypothetical protein